MREIIKTLIQEGIEREDIVEIAKYLMEEYEVNEDTVSYIKKRRIEPLDKVATRVFNKEGKKLDKEKPIEAEPGDKYADGAEYQMRGEFHKEMGKRSGNKPLEKAGEKIKHYGELMQKAEELRDPNQHRKPTKNQKGERKHAKRQASKNNGWDDEPIERKIFAANGWQV